MLSTLIDVFSLSSSSKGSEDSPDTDIIGNKLNGITLLKLYHSATSYNEILQDERIIKYVGYGQTLGHGHPSANQQWLNQEPFRLSWEKSHIIPVLYVNSYGARHMGNYIIKDIVKKMGCEGFTFFHIILQRTDFTGPDLLAVKNKHKDTTMSRI
jgi:hypothetical protein